MHCSKPNTHVEIYLITLILMAKESLCLVLPLTIKMESLSSNSVSDMCQIENTYSVGSLAVFKIHASEWPGESGELDWPSGSMWRQFFLMLSSRKAWSLPTWAGSAWISLQLTSCRGRQCEAKGITQASKTNAGVFIYDTLPHQFH